MTNKVLLILSAVFIFTACTQAGNLTSAQTIEKNVSIKTTNTANNPIITQTKNLPDNECKICDFDFANYKGNLKKEEIEGLLLALNDEYLAAATYEQVNKDFDNPRPFINIVKSELRHIERLRSLFEAYKINFPENVWTGNAPKYKTTTEACKAGVDGEIINKQLYDKLFKSTTREDILTVYRALQRASEENHLPAFERCGQGGGNGRGIGRGKFDN